MLLCTLNQCSVKGVLGQLGKSGKWGKAGDSRLGHKSDSSTLHRLWFRGLDSGADSDSPRFIAIRLDKSKLSGRPWTVATGGSWFIWLTRTVTNQQAKVPIHLVKICCTLAARSFFLWREDQTCINIQTCLAGSWWCGDDAWLVPCLKIFQHRVVTSSSCRQETNCPLAHPGHSSTIPSFQLGKTAGRLLRSRPPRKSANAFSKSI